MNMQTFPADALAAVESKTTQDLARLHELARTFPSLAKRQIGPAILSDLRAIALDDANGSGVRHAARFVLSVWAEGISSPAFSARQAWACWDDKHRAAWQAWAASPWWV